MSRYIDADLLQAQIERGAEMTEKGIRLLDLSQQPEVDAVPVVHAHWIKDKSTRNSYYCSYCHSYKPPFSEYCPHCGARMDEQEET